MSDAYNSFVQSISKPDQPRGPAAAYTPVHVVKALFIVDSSRSVGRVMLSRALGIGEGSVRTIIKRLQERSFITIDSIGGCTLTPIGKEVLQKIRDGMVSSAQIDLGGLGINQPSYAIHIRFDISTHSILKLRDVAIRWGADGAIIFNFTGNRIVVPTISEDLSISNPSVYYALVSKFNLQEGDSIIATFAKDYATADSSALAVFLYLKGIQ
ncbi:MAG: DUF4443 domain-containing protein [Candidatus Verstraetearchaeota archaeon]|nr:DUF4443 domain-containing protein [Candidatus Verstraetearchaeota archaeon]